jgi:mannitol-1-/sugar-/sorbitol-6-/2-deoxyglucose-6-phosphatase
MKAVQALVFDMDGVLIDFEVLWRQVREEFCHDHGKTWTAQDQLATMGCNTRMWSRLMVERLNLTEDLGLDDATAAAAAAKEIIDRMVAKFDQHLPRREGAIEAVQSMARSYKVALATGSPNDLASYVMQVTGLDKVFLATVCGDDVICGKPAPNIYLKVLDKISVSPQDSVGVEDSANGIRSLRATGMGIIAAPGPDFPLTEDELAMANCRIDAMTEISVSLVEKVGLLNRNWCLT